MAKKELVELTELVARIAKQKGVAHEKMGKQVRSRIRSAFDKGDLVPSKHWPAYAKAGKVNRDGNRYPAMPAATAEAIFQAMCKGKSLEEALKKPRRTSPAQAADKAPEPTTEA